MFQNYVFVPVRTLLKVEWTLRILLKERPDSKKWPERSIFSRSLRKWNSEWWHWSERKTLYYHYKNQRFLSTQKKYQTSHTALTPFHEKLRRTFYEEETKILKKNTLLPVNPKHWPFPEKKQAMYEHLLTSTQRLRFQIAFQNHRFSRRQNVIY